MNAANIRLQDKATLVILNCGFSWGTITDKGMTDELTQAKGSSRGSLRARKTLLPDGAGVHVDAVRKELSAFYIYHTGRTYATPIMGQRLMPTAFYVDYMTAFADAKSRAEIALSVLETNYDASISQARGLLKDAFNPQDYPPVEEIREYFNMKVRFLPVPDGDNIMNALGKGVAADVDLFVDEMRATASADARERLHEAVKRMATVLTSKGKVYDSMPGAINELAKELPVIAGLAGDKELAALVKEVKEALTGFSGDDFRKDEGVRTAVGRQAAEILKKFQ